jgi:hypothetical protein
MSFLAGIASIYSSGKAETHDPNDGTLNVSFGLFTRLRWGWLAFRYPHAIRNTLHFVQEAEECVKAIVGGELAGALSDAELATHARIELSNATYLIKLLQDYGGKD